MQKYLPWALEIAAEFQIDPIWYLSVMWTESHFKPNALSKAGARGLMQVIPDTNEFVQKQLGEKTYQRISKNGPTYVNMYIGGYYLHYLYHKFQGNYIYATVGYNMGPYWVIRRRLENGPIGVKNQYLDKVKDAYAKMAMPLKEVFAKVPEPYKTTLAFRTVYRTNPYWRYRWQEFSSLLYQPVSKRPARKFSTPYLLSSNTVAARIYFSQNLVQF